MPYPAKTDRDTILKAAMNHVEAHGLRGLSLRSIAATLGITPNALYRYFADRAVLEAALAEEVSRRLHAAMQRAVRNDDPEQAIRGIARAYLAFARKYPNLYELLLLPCDKESEEEDAHALLTQFVAQHVAALTGPTTVEEATVSLWAFLHGIAQFEAIDLFGYAKPDPTIQFGLDAWLMAASSRHNLQTS
jgi:AcrR family transcriptional regulator